MIFKGFKFGMLLQMAVGPLCLLVFQIAATSGLLHAFSAVIAVTLADGLEIVLSLAGITALLKKYQLAKNFLKYLGALVLLIFGLGNILSAFGQHSPIIPTVHTLSGIFSSAFLLTLTNPLTLVFWAGLFSAKISEENIQKSDLYYFALGCLLATIFFLSLVALASSFIHTFFPAWLLKLFQLLLGIILICWAGKSIKA